MMEAGGGRSGERENGIERFVAAHCEVRIGFGHEPEATVMDDGERERERATTSLSFATKPPAMIIWSLRTMMLGERKDRTYTGPMLDQTVAS